MVEMSALRQSATDAPPGEPRRPKRRARHRPRWTGWQRKVWEPRRREAILRSLLPWRDSTTWIEARSLASSNGQRRHEREAGEKRCSPFPRLAARDAAAASALFDVALPERCGSAFAAGLGRIRRADALGSGQVAGLARVGAARLTADAIDAEAGGALARLGAVVAVLERALADAVHTIGPGAAIGLAGAAREAFDDAARVGPAALRLHVAAAGAVADPRQRDPFLAARRAARDVPARIGAVEAHTVAASAADRAIAGAGGPSADRDALDGGAGSRRAGGIAAGALTLAGRVAADAVDAEAALAGRVGGADGPTGCFGWHAPDWQ